MKNSELRNWSFVNRKMNFPLPLNCKTNERLDEYFSTHLEQEVFLWGNVYNDYRKDETIGFMKDGHRILSSVILRFSGNEVHTLNSIYKLENPNTEFVKWFNEQGYDLDKVIKQSETIPFVYNSPED